MCTQWLHHRLCGANIVFLLVITLLVVSVYCEITNIVPNVIILLVFLKNKINLIDVLAFNFFLAGNNYLARACQDLTNDVDMGTLWRYLGCPSDINAQAFSFNFFFGGGGAWWTSIIITGMCGNGYSVEIALARKSTAYHEITIDKFYGVLSVHLVTFSFYIHF